MIKRTITYTNFADEEITEDWYFHMSKAEALELEAGEKGGMSELVKQIIAEQDTTKLFRIFKTMVRTAVGKRSADGKRFNKSPEIVEEFEGLGACDQLIFDLLSDEDGSARFFNGFLPKDLQEQTAGVKIEVPAFSETPKPKISVKDLQAMGSEDFNKLYSSRSNQL